MNNDELKRALVMQSPILCDGIVYECIEEIVYARKRSATSFAQTAAPGIMVFARLKDRCGHSFTQASPKNIEVFTDDKT